MTPRAYLCRTVSRLALNRLRTVSRRREDYVGPWLPEPLVAREDVATQVADADAVSTAMLVVLESLGPVERVVFVLREVFGFEYDEVAEVVQKAPDNVRQIAHRARSHVQARRPRFAADRTAHRDAVERFKLAAETGDVDLLLSLWPRTWCSPPTGVARSRRRCARSWDARRWCASSPASWPGRTWPWTSRTSTAVPGWWSASAAVLDTVASFDLEEGLATRLWVTRNPAKLAGLTS